MESLLNWVMGDNSSATAPPAAAAAAAAAAPAAEPPAEEAPPAAAAAVAVAAAAPPAAAKEPEKKKEEEEEEDGSSGDEEEEEDEEEMLPPEALIRLFERFRNVVQTDGVRKRLRDAFEAGQSLEDEILAVQKDVCEEFKVNGDYGVRCFQRVLVHYRDNPMVIQYYVRHSQIASMACDEAELGPEKFKEKLAKMRQERMEHMMAAQRQMQERLQGMSPEQFVEEMKAKLSNMDPAQMERIKALAAARANPNLSAEEIMQQTQAKIQATMRMMEQGGVEQQAALRQAFEALRTGQMPPGLMQHSHGMAAMHGHSHNGQPCHGHGHSHGDLDLD